jgi:histidinol dehydrogenase
LITDSPELASRAEREIDKQIATMERESIVVESLKNGGMIVIVADIDTAIELSNIYAPEHLCLIIDKAESYIDRITNAGCIFIGDKATVVIGDYVAGPSHTLPTGGTARFSSPLNILDFIKFINVVKVDDNSLKELGEAAITIARAEGLEAHAIAVEKRLGRD